MAKPIKETPILKGKDAIKFLEERNNVSKNPIAITKEKERILQNYKLLQSAETFNKHIGT